MARWYRDGTVYRDRERLTEYDRESEKPLSVHKRARPGHTTAHAQSGESAVERWRYEVNESREKVVVQRLDVMALQVNIEELVLVRVGSCCSCQFVWFVWFVWFVSVRVGSCSF